MASERARQLLHVFRTQRINCPPPSYGVHDEELGVPWSELKILGLSFSHKTDVTEVILCGPARGFCRS